MSFKDMWDNAEAPIDPPKGTYQVKIVRAEAKPTNAGDDKANAILKITEGDLAGKTIDHFMWMAHEVSAAINKEALLAYGINDAGIDSIEALDNRLQELVGRTAEVGVSYKDGRMNIKVHGSRSPNGTPSDIPAAQESFEPKPAASFAAAAGGADDDTPPF